MNPIYPPPSAEPELERETEVKTRWSRAKSQRISGRYLKKTALGPIQHAARLPGRALHVYLAIRHRCDLQRGQTVTLLGSYLKSWGIGKDAKQRGLAELEQAGLIEVERRTGRPSVVTLCRR